MKNAWGIPIVLVLAIVLLNEQNAALGIPRWQDTPHGGGLDVILLLIVAGWGLRRFFLWAGRS